MLHRWERRMHDATLPAADVPGGAEMCMQQPQVTRCNFPALVTAKLARCQVPAIACKPALAVARLPHMGCSLLVSSAESFTGLISNMQSLCISCEFQPDAFAEC